ncbi:hypothetical protein ACFWD7_51335 [Streptomyces mirabilis]|uniref:hypothetical protein n=1 Tax=Streptomyces mirabilis TaxID=68239 RepID=UPI003691B110
MIVILGLVIFIAAVVVGVAGVLTNSASGHELTGGFSVFGHEMIGSTGTLFLYGIVVGAGPVRADPALDRCAPPLFSPRRRLAPRTQAVPRRYGLCREGPRRPGRPTRALPRGQRECAGERLTPR